MTNGERAVAAGIGELDSREQESLWLPQQLDGVTHQDCNLNPCREADYQLRTSPMTKGQLAIIPTY